MIWLLANWKWIGIGVLVVSIGVQTARLSYAKHDLAAARDKIAEQNTAIGLLQTAIKKSETNRDVENQHAVDAAGAADLSCQARVSAALKTGSKIRTLVEKPRDVPVDPTTHCPGHALIPNSELRDLFQAAP